MFKRTVATLASGTLLALLIAPSARAEGPEQLAGYAAGSSATALAISLLDQEIAFSSTTAAVSSEGPTSAADGAALLIAGSPVPEGAPAQTPGGAPTNSVCPVDVDLGELTEGAADGLAVSIGCVETSATVPDGAPTARSAADEVVIQVNGLSGTVLDPIVAPLIAALEDTLDQTEQALLCEEGGLLDTLGVCVVVEETTQIDLDALVDEIIANLGELDNELFTVAQIRVAPSLSTASATADGVLADAGSTGVFVELFPGLAAAIDEIVDDLIPEAEVDAPLLTLGLGNAQAMAFRDPVDGEAKTKAVAAQLLGVDVTDSLGILSQLLEQDVPGLVDSLSAAGAALSCTDGALRDLLCVDLGTTRELDAAEAKALGYDFGADTLGSEATAASIAVLPVLGELLGGESVLGVQLSQASAAATAGVAQDQSETPRGSLPRTGGTPSLPVVLGLFGAAAVGVAAIRRTRTV